MATDTTLAGLEAVAKRYGLRSRWVLADVNAEVHPGQAIHVAGPNGAGKSTLLRLLVGCTRANRGRRWAASGLRIGYAPDVLATPPLTMAAYLRHRARTRGLDRRGASRETKQLLERLGLNSLAGEALPTLSRGSLQKVGAVQALLGAPSLLVLDEPCSGLDTEAQRELRALVAERVRDGAAVVFSDHHASPLAHSASERWELVAGSCLAVAGRFAA